MRVKISDMFDSYLDNDASIESKNVASADKIKELTMNKVNYATGHVPEYKHRRTRRVFALLVAAIVVLALTITAIATYYYWQPAIAEYFGVNSSQQAALLEDGTTVLLDVPSVSVKSLNGIANFTVSVYQVIGDKHTLQVLLKYESDTPGVFTQEFVRNAVSNNRPQLLLNGEYMSGGGGYIMNDDYSCFYTMRLDSPVDGWEGGTIEVRGHTFADDDVPVDADEDYYKKWK